MSAKVSSTAIGATAANPTMCCATTSYWLLLERIGSSARSRTSFAVTVASTRSLMFVATSTPWLLRLSECPERPMRWIARETPFGVATITTRSTAPISIPISRLVEQTTARSSPFFSRSSTSSRTLRSSEA